MEPTLMVIGLNLRTAAAVSERFRIDDGQHRRALLTLSRAEGVEEVVVLATRARTEFLLWADDVSLAANSVLHLLTAEYGLKMCEWQHFYRLLDDAALLHIFSVASDQELTADDGVGMVEKMQAAWLQAHELGVSGHVLGSVLEKAFEVAEGMGDEGGQNTGNRARTAAEEHGVVIAEAQGFRRKLLAGCVVPTIMALRHRLDQICRQELDRFKQECGPFSKDQDEILQAVTTRMTQKIAGSLAHELKEVPEKMEHEQMTAAVQRLFHLEPPDTTHDGASYLRN
jgi:glutamyl-tRNA reductase